MSIRNFKKNTTSATTRHGSATVFKVSLYAHKLKNTGPHRTDCRANRRGPRLEITAAAMNAIHPKTSRPIVPAPNHRGPTLRATPQNEVAYLPPSIDEILPLPTTAAAMNAIHHKTSRPIVPAPNHRGPTERHPPPIVVAHCFASYKDDPLISG